MNSFYLSILLYSEGFGMTVTLVGFTIVFLALTLLVMVFSRLPKIINANLIKYWKQQRANREADETLSDDYHVEGNVTAAISLALHLYFSEMHDEESDVITIKKVRRTYSPWSSKIYGVNQNWPAR
ncbi:MAG: OadG family protein [Bacteroidales bacterium]|nr:OadG family protein [Bacteroidales bacterium]MBN2774796.1 OadG family protein [Prolixibacteraceae bacterium]